MQKVKQTQLMVCAPATLLLLSDISLELGVVWPAIRQRGFGDHPYFLGRSLQLSRFIHFYETVWSEFVGSEANEMPEIPCVRRNVSLRDRVCDPCAGKHIPDDMVGFYSAYADANVFIAIRQDHAIGSELLVGAVGASRRSSLRPPGFRATGIEVFLAMLQILQKGFLGK